MNPADRIKHIENKIIKTSLIHSSGSMLFALGLLATFVDDAGSLHPWLENQTAVNIMLVVGAAIIISGGYKVIMLSKEKMELKQKNGQKF